MKNFGKIFILGDSYSTYYPYIPDGYESYYGYWSPDIETVDKTWWGLIIKDTESELAMNESYSGTTVCNTGYNHYSCPETSFIGRFDKYADENGMDGIDTVFIMGGTNDCWCGAPLGEIKYGEYTEEDLKAFLPAFSYLISTVQKKAPHAEIVNLVNCGLDDVITQGQVDICAHYGVKCILLHDIDKLEDGHPTFVGMKQIEEQILDSFE